MKIQISKSKLIIFIIILLAIICRIIFINKADIGLFQYDVGLKNSLKSEEDYENVYFDLYNEKTLPTHINYIMYLYKYNKLPSEIIGQFYHPPLHHFILAQWLKFVDLFSNVSSIKLESIQYVIVFYSIILLISLYKILEELNIDDKHKIVPIILFSFYPLSTYMSGLINNDELVTMFCILSFLYLIKWEKVQSYKNAILVAIFIGLGMMTKSSAIMMIIPAMYIYFKKVNEYVSKDKSLKNLVIQLFVLCIIIIVLGTWFHIFNRFKNSYNLSTKRRIKSYYR